MFSKQQIYILSVLYEATTPLTMREINQTGGRKLQLRRHLRNLWLAGLIEYIHSTYEITQAGREIKAPISRFEMTTKGRLWWQAHVRLVESAGDD